MVTVGGFLFIYTLGGFTFLPLLLAALLLHAHLTQPHGGEDDEPQRPQLQLSREEAGAAKSELDGLPEGLKTRAHEPGVAAGYFAVCREYVPGGVNGKPPERTTPAGAVVAPESPSIYQNMYRSIFDRNKTTSPIPEGNKVGGKTIKKARNVFYVVLRLGVLMLFDDSEQLEVRYVISLEHHDVDVYAGGEKIPEGELWIKRNCIRLTKRVLPTDDQPESKPFYLFSENQSDKEDLYFAMLKNQERTPGLLRNPPTPLNFPPPHIVKLVQQLHATEENLHTRWFNALLGRVFLAVYRTPQVENFIRMKFTKKIARVNKPGFLKSIQVQRIEMGDSAPLFTQPKLRELTVDGDLTVEADVKYRGNFRLEIAALARIELGSRFKAREVNLVLAGLLKGLEGHVLLRIKPPPSNRIWMSFETTPKLDMSIEPIVSSRQITYGVILRAIESRIREVLNETLVYPNWDDMPFTDTTLQRFRGGIWEDDAKVKESTNPQTVAAQKGLVDEVEKICESEEDDPATVSMSPLKDSANSSPSLEPNKSVPKSRKGTKASSSDDAKDSAVSSGADPRPGKLRPGRSYSFASTSASMPVLNTDPATAEAIKAESGSKSHQDATTVMKDISSRSQPTSPIESPVGSPQRVSHMSREKRGSQSSAERDNESVSRIDLHTSAKAADENLLESEHDGARDQPAPVSHGRKSSITVHSPTSIEGIPESATPAKGKRSRPGSIRSTASVDRQSLNASLNSATAVAKNWGMNILARHNNSAATLPSDISHQHASSSRSSTLDSVSSAPLTAPLPSNPSSQAVTSESAPGTPANPMGRGQPLPPPGQPLPRPGREGKSGQGWVDTLSNLTKRKPVPPRRPSASSSHHSTDKELNGKEEGDGTPPKVGSLESTSALTEGGLPPSITPPPPAAIPAAPSSTSSSATPAHRERWRRRTRSSLSTGPMAGAATSAAEGSPANDGLMVVEAPAEIESAKTSPVVERKEMEVQDEDSMDVAGTVDADGEGVFGLDMDGHGDVKKEA